MMADVARGAVAVVGHGLDDDGDAARAVAFVGDGLVAVALTGGSRLFEHTLDVVVRHVGRLGLGDDGRQTGVIGRVCHATAFFDGNDHFLRNFGKGRRALCVLRALRFLNVMPLGMSGHVVSSLRYNIACYFITAAQQKSTVCRTNYRNCVSSRCARARKTGISGKASRKIPSSTSQTGFSVSKCPASMRLRPRYFASSK